MVKKSNIILSIIIPAYNCESYISECLNSVLDYNPKGIEIIVVEDGSTDGTKSILAGYENVYNNLKILYCSHKGSSAAINIGLDNSTGEYVTFLECDDIIKTGFIRGGFELLSKEADLYAFGIERLSLTGERDLWNLTDNEYSDVSSFAADYSGDKECLVSSTCNKFYRRNIIEDNQLRFDESLPFVEDGQFNKNFFPYAGSIITSSLIMLSDIQRKESAEE